MIGEFNQCRTCKHKLYLGCTAYPNGIPEEISTDNHDHRRPYPGDQGIRWEPKTPGDKHPLEVQR